MEFFKNYNSREVQTDYAKYVFAKGELAILFNTVVDCVNYTEINAMINKYAPRIIIISQITTGGRLKNIVDNIGKINIPLNANLLIDLRHVGITGLKGFHKNSVLDLSQLPKNVHIDINNGKHTQNEFVTWAHNLEEGRLSLLECLTTRSRELFLLEEQVISMFASELFLQYRDIIYEKSKKTQFDIIFNYLKENYPYYGNAIDASGLRTKPGFEWTHDPVATFAQRKGVCEGRSELLKLVTNNRIFGLDCYTASGENFEDISHEWNHFIDGNTLYLYDLSYDGMVAMNGFDHSSFGYRTAQIDANVDLFLKRINASRIRQK